MTLIKRLLLILFAVGPASCTYLGTAFKQAGYSAEQSSAPSQRIYKHMLTAENFFVFGRILHEDALNREEVAVVALCDRYRESEVVDVSHFSRLNSYYGLNLPEGNYRLLVVSDLNDDGFYDGTEVVGGRTLSLDRNDLPDKVLGAYHIDLAAPGDSGPGAAFRLEVQKPGELAASLFYPEGSIRSLDDRIFSPRMATLGMYEPAAFMEQAPMLFYALEEDVGYKVPVIYVHGINGSVRDFEPLVARLDRNLYRPWFFYYPSGYDLAQLSEIFYDIFLSGEVIPLQETPVVIVAHSMGGLVVRDAMNRITGEKGENGTKLLITIASPMGGHPDATMGARGPVAVPSWRDLAPESAFMRGLRRKTLPNSLDYHLIYAYGNPSILKLGENSDGVVPLSSQLCPAAQDEATAEHGFNDSHMGILKNPEAVGRIIKLIEEVRPPFPEDHMKELLKGGYKVELGTEYSAMEKYHIRTSGRWMDALASGVIAPIHPAQADFVKACRGEKSPGNEAETAWLKFSREFPDRSGLR